MGFHMAYMQWLHTNYFHKYTLTSMLHLFVTNITVIKLKSDLWLKMTCYTFL